MTTASPNHTNLREIVEDLHRLTAFHGDLGLEYACSEQLDSILQGKKAHKSPVPPRTPISHRPKPLTKKQPASQKVRPPQTAVSSGDLNNCRKCIEECNACPHKKPPKFGIGATDHPFIFIVCDRNSSDPSRPMQEAEESLLGKMLAAIKIKPSQIFVTTIIKCHVEDSSPQTQKAMVENCLSHTMQQIRLMQPSLICTMGQLSSQALLKSQNQLMALRGHFHTYMDIPLMPTYHPAQLIALPELKKATWFDLQLMQRQLAMAST